MNKSENARVSQEIQLINRQTKENGYAKQSDAVNSMPDVDMTRHFFDWPPNYQAVYHHGQ